MHEYCPPGVDPLAPEAPLIFVFSPLVGTPLTTSAKFAVVAKSPLTGRLTDALASSHFAIAGKLTGHDAIIVRGCCTEPSVLMIDGSSVWVAPAEDLWEVVRDPHHLPRWWPRVQRVEDVDGDAFTEVRITAKGNDAGGTTVFVCLAPGKQSPFER